MNERQDGLGEAMRAVATMANPGGCAWHEAQTHESLTRYLIEETHEFVEAVETDAAPEVVADELGDVLYQVLFHTAIAERDGEGYNFDSVAKNLAKKLIDRHPHVFSDRGYMSYEELEAEWEHLKEAAQGDERGSRHALEGIPENLPTMARAAKVVDRLLRAGKLREEAAETSEQEIGEELLAVVKKAVASGIDPDRALRVATRAASEA